MNSQIRRVILMLSPVSLMGSVGSAHQVFAFYLLRLNWTSSIYILLNFYRAMLCTSIGCPSVTDTWTCLNVCDVQVCFHTGWIISKIISRQNGLRSLLTLTPTWAIWSNGNTPKLGWNRARSTKPAISPKRCKIGPRLLWRTNRKNVAWRAPLISP